MSPNQPKTPLRNVRIEEVLWQRAKEIAATRGETVSDVLRLALLEYVDRYGGK